jgi:D-arabinose 1-dehydrogenase-like Zn-dependent alcohol dehydrogenase
MKAAVCNTFNGAICSQCMIGNQHICDRHFQAGFANRGSFSQYVQMKNTDSILSIPFREVFNISLMFAWYI